MIKRTAIIDVKLSVKEIAHCICEMDSMEQADLLNTLANMINKWEDKGASASFQLQAITDEQMLSKEARTLMSKIGEYSAPY